MAQSVGEVAIDIVVGQNNVSSAVGKAMGEAEKTASSGSSKLKGALSGMGSVAKTIGKTAVVGLSAAAAGISALGSKAISEYANYEQLVGGVDTLFKNSSQKVQQYAANAYQTAGMSANEYMETVTSFSASLLQSLGGDTEKAAEQANKAVTDMSDNANKMGTNIADIQHAYQGFAKQNYTMLDNLKLGYGGTKKEMERLLADAEKISGIKYDISSYSDVVDAIHVMQESMGIAGTTAKEASTTIEGSINSMKSAWSNLLTGMADGSQNMSVLAENFANSVFTVADNIVPRIAQVLTGISSAIEKLAPKMTEKIPGILNQLLPALVSGATSLVNSLVAALPGILGAITSILPQLIEGVATIFQGICDALPQLVQTIVQALPTIIPALVSGLVNMAVSLMTMLPQIIQPIINALPQIITSLVNALIENLPLLIAGAIQLVVGLVAAIPQIIAGLIEAGPQIVSGIADGIVAAGGILTEKAGAIFEPLKGIVSGAWEAIKTIVGTAVNLIVGIVTVAWDAIKLVVTTVGSAIGTAVSTVWNAIKTTVITVVNAIKTVIITVWNAIKTAVTTVINAIKTVITTVWNVIKTIITTVVNGIKTVITTAFNTIKTVITTVVNAIKTVITTVWNAIKTVITTVVNAIKAVVTTVWNAIKTVVTTVVNGIKNTVGKVWDGIKEKTSSAFNAVKEKTSSAWSKVKDTVSKHANSAKESANKAWANIKSGIQNNSGGIQNAVSNCFSGAKDKIKNFAQQAVGWGKDFADGLASGIRSAAGKVADAAKSLGSKVKSYLHFSRPDVGPLRDYETWMPDFVGGLASGITKNQSKVTKAVSNLAIGMTGAVKKITVSDDLVALEEHIAKVNADAEKVRAKRSGKSTIKNGASLIGASAEKWGSAVTAKAYINPAPKLKNVRTSESLENSSGSSSKGTMSSEDFKTLLDNLKSMFKETIDSINSSLNVTIPVYIGNDLIDEQMSKATTRKTVRSGGHA